MIIKLPGQSQIRLKKSNSDPEYEQRTNHWLLGTDQFTCYLPVSSVVVDIDYVYMHTDSPSLFRIRQQSEFDTGHVNSISGLDILS